MCGRFVAAAKNGIVRETILSVRHSPGLHCTGSVDHWSRTRTRLRSTSYNRDSSQTNLRCICSAFSLRTAMAISVRVMAFAKWLPSLSLRMSNRQRDNVNKNKHISNEFEVRACTRQFQSKYAKCVRRSQVPIELITAHRHTHTHTRTRH